MNFLRCIVKALVLAGALNWGLVGFFDYNLVADIFGGEASPGARVVFALVGLAGVLFLICWCRGAGCCKCGSGCGTCGSGCSCGKGGSCGSRKEWKDQ